MVAKFAGPVFWRLDELEDTKALLEHDARVRIGWALEQIKTRSPLGYGTLQGKWYTDSGEIRAQVRVDRYGVAQVLCSLAGIPIEPEPPVVPPVPPVEPEEPPVVPEEPVKKKRIPPLFILYGDGFDAVYALEPNPDVEPYGVGTQVAELSGWRLFEYELPDGAVSFDYTVCTKDGVVMLRRNDDETADFAEEYGEVIGFSRDENLWTVWFAGGAYYGLYWVDDTHHRVIPVSADSLSDPGSYGVEINTNLGSVAISADGKTATFYGYGYSWQEDYSNGGYVDVPTFFVTDGPDDTEPSEDTSSSTTNLDKPTPGEIVDWIYDYLIARGWDYVDPDPLTIYDVVKATRAYGAPTTETYTRDQLRPPDTDSDPAATRANALGAAQAHFGVTFMDFTVCTTPECEEESVHPGKQGIGFMLYPYGNHYYFPVVSAFDRVTTVEYTSILEDSSDGYVQMKRADEPQLVTTHQKIIRTTKSTTHFPWETSGSGSEAVEVEVLQKVGDTVLVSLTADGTTTTQETKSYILELGIHDDRVDEFPYDGGESGIPALKTIYGPVLISPVTADISGLFKRFDDDGLATGIYGYRDITAEETDLTSLFTSIMTGDLDSSISIAAFRGSDDPTD